MTRKSTYSKALAIYKTKQNRKWYTLIGQLLYKNILYNILTTIRSLKLLNFFLHSVCIIPYINLCNYIQQTSAILRIIWFQQTD